MSGFIHKDSMPCVKSELDLFILPPTQTAIEKGQYVEFFPIANIRDGGPLEFNLSGSTEELFDLNASHIYVKVKIVKSDGSDLDDKDDVAPVNLFLHSLFSQVDVSLNERVISTSNNTYPYRAYLETLLNYGEDAKKSMLTCECFYKDNNLSEPNPKATTNANTGLKKRYELTSGSKSLEMIGQLHCDIFQQERLLLNMVDVKIKFTRSKPNFCLMSALPNEYKVILEHASLFIRKVKVSPGVSLGHAKALEKSTAKYPIDRVLCKFYTISTGSWNFLQDNVFLGHMPKRVIVGCLDNAAVSGQYNLNPFLFDHYNINFLCLYMDGHPVPSKPLELDFQNNNYIRAYHQLFRSFNEDKGIYLTREEYAKGHTLFAFDLSADLCNGPHLSLQQQGNLRLEVKFAQALPKTISIFIYAEFENVIEITKSRNIICDFPN